MALLNLREGKLKRERRSLLAYAVTHCLTGIKTQEGSICRCLTVTATSAPRGLVGGGVVRYVIAYLDGLDVSSHTRLAVLAVQVTRAHAYRIQLTDIRREKK